MDGVFSAGALKGLGCQGKRPWLSTDEDCGADCRTLQRGASNLYFPVHESALSIPPWEDWLQESIGIYWQAVCGGTPELRRSILQPIADLRGDDLDTLVEEVDKRIKYLNEPEREDLRRDEYLNFMEAGDWAKDDDKGREFSVVSQPVPDPLKPFFRQDRQSRPTT